MKMRMIKYNIVMRRRYMVEEKVIMKREKGGV
jgi:hypothetical protein